MVSPVTVIDETSNDDDDVMLNLNLDLTIDDCGSDGIKNDNAMALAAAEKAAAAEIAAAAKDAAERAAAEIAAAAKDAVKKAGAEMAAAAKDAEKAAAAERAAAEKDVVEKAAAAAKAAAERAAAEMAAAAKDAVKKAAAEMAAAAKDAVNKAAAEIAAAAKDAAEKAAAAERGRNTPTRGLRIWPVKGPHLSLTVRHGRVVLANSNGNDVYQQWYCDSFSHHVLEGLPTFILRNNGTGLSLQHSIRYDYPVRLINHRVGETDRSVLWTREFQSGGRAMTIMNVDDISLELVVHNRNFQEGEKIINYTFQCATRHYWNVTPW